MDGKLRVDRAVVRREARFDGKFLLRSSDDRLSAEEIALGYKALYEAERGWRDMKSTILPDGALGHIDFIVRKVRDHLFAMSCDHAGALFYCPTCGTRMAGPNRAISPR